MLYAMLPLPYTAAAVMWLAATGPAASQFHVDEQPVYVVRDNGITTRGKTTANANA